MAAPATSLPPSLSLALLLLLLSISSSQAGEIVVGGSPEGGWTIPSSETTFTLNAWAESSRFRIGDSLVFRYDAAQDSVLQVTRAGYLSCNASGPVAQHVNKDGEAKVELERSGAFYFISGAPGHCEKGQKLIVVVLSPRHAYARVSSPAPAPVELEGPAVAPTSGAERSGLDRGLALAAGSLLGVVGLGLF
ncbi:early nodulin-like protein 1 [Rhodamnia argentea]|uniref:Early nodulin-like protein 1 n=1 Tax=Rhodamnia argentea TaxID=178133 RepID=A0A8B8NLW1_9MYRT|nr:early nodulin-like protein 1 [Rhodamnia argentea]